MVAEEVAGGTTWMWAREDFVDLVDVLIVDEAGQISLANVLAASQAAKSVILLGDPQQLDQPLKGSHRDGVAVSALQDVGRKLNLKAELSDCCRLNVRLKDFSGAWATAYTARMDLIRLPAPCQGIRTGASLTGMTSSVIRI